MHSRRPVCRKDRFALPEGIIYLDGNSLGALPKGCAEAAIQTVEREWGEGLIRSWNAAGWMDWPREVGDAIAPLVGAAPGTIATGDTLSIKVFQALAAALAMRPDRRVVVSDTGNFPSDLYIARALLDLVDGDYELRLVEPHEVEDAAGDDVAALLLTHVDYRTGRMHDMTAITRAAHAAGVATVWDLAHSAGAVPVDLAACGAEFAVGCTYKYLNGGPGAPAFVYVRPDLHETVQPALAGWLGHAAPFAMERDYRPAPGVARMRVGTPSVIQFAVLREALKVFEDVDMGELRAASIALSERFAAGVEAIEGLRLASPRDPHGRGSQLSFAHEDAYAVCQALIERGVIGDFREPDLVRFGFAPLYLDETDIDRALEHLEAVIANGEWREPRFRTRAAVT